MDSTLAILKPTVKKDQTASIFVNVTILDIAPVYIGDYYMIGTNTMITTVNNPLLPKGRKNHIGKDACKDWELCLDWWKLYTTDTKM